MKLSIFFQGLPFRKPQIIKKDKIKRHTKNDEIQTINVIIFWIIRQVFLRF